MVIICGGKKKEVYTLEMRSKVSPVVQSNE